MRMCTHCGAVGFKQGYVIDGGFEYFCSDECLHTTYTPEEWLELYADGTSEFYWTEWEEDEEDEEDE